MTDNIDTAINKIMTAVGYVKKQRAQGLNYTFAGETDLIEALRPEMVENGVYCFVSDYAIISEEPYTTSKGTLMQNVRIKANIVFRHAPSDTHITVCSLGEGSDTADKATNKAMTGAYKYALRQTFCIETGDDPDKERVDRAPKQQPAKQAKAKPAMTDDKPNLAPWVLQVENSQGEPYWTLPTEKLSHMANAIIKAMEGDITEEQRVEYERKQTAIGHILAERNK